MLDSLCGRLTYANAMASVAVFIALGGSSYAAVMLTNNSVKPCPSGASSRQIQIWPESASRISS